MCQAGHRHPRALYVLVACASPLAAGPTPDPWLSLSWSLHVFKAAPETRFNDGALLSAYQVRKGESQVMTVRRKLGEEPGPPSL